MKSHPDVPARRWCTEERDDGSEISHVDVREYPSGGEPVAVCRNCGTRWRRGLAVPTASQIVRWVERLRLEPGDIAVLTFDRFLAREDVNELRTRLGEQLGGGNKILLLMEGLTLAALTRAEIEAMAE